MSILFAIALLILPPCQSEDSNWCAWNAATMGNGAGSSFITLNERTFQP